MSSIILFARSVLFLKYLPDYDLGLIMLFQAIISLLGLTQIGLFNGGLRIFSIESEASSYQIVNNTNITYVVNVTILFMILSVLFYLIYRGNILIFLIAAFTGGFVLLKNWFSNLLIARKRLKEINMLNLVSAVSSASLAFTIFLWGTSGALISISSSYIIFVVMFVVLQKEYRPSQFKLSFLAIRRMLAYGFIPFLSGIAVLLNNQIDRFFIAEWISLDALGKFYLAATFITVFDLVPVNLNSLFLPNAINSYSEKRLNDTLRTTRLYFYILFAYACLAGIALFFFGELIVNAIFPDKIDQLKYLIIMFPGIIAIVLSKPFGFLLYVVLHLKAILWSNIFSLLTYLSILVLLRTLSVFTIENVAYGKTIQGILFFLFLILSVAFSWEKIKQFYFTEIRNNIYHEVK